MAKRAIALTTLLVTATLSPPAEATAVAEPIEPGPPTPDLDESMAIPEVPDRPVAPAPPAVVAQPAVVVHPAPSSPSTSSAEPATSAANTGARAGRTVRSGDPLARIRACESGSNYQARSASGRYRGAYQFDRGTWASVGGSGDPAAAPPAEQDQRARMLHARSGGAAWPVCSGRR